MVMYVRYAIKSDVKSSFSYKPEAANRRVPERTGEMSILMLSGEEFGFNKNLL
jgi:hypothetical protein